MNERIYISMSCIS